MQPPSRWTLEEDSPLFCLVHERMRASKAIDKGMQADVMTLLLLPIGEPVASNAPRQGSGDKAEARKRLHACRWVPGGAPNKVGGNRDDEPGTAQRAAVWPVGIRPVPA